MRKAATVIGLGAFFLTMALLLKFYAYDKLAVVPLDQNTRQTVVDNNATFFDADTVKAASGKLTTIATVIGDKGASEALQDSTGKDVAVFNKGQTTDNNDEAPPMDALQQTFAIDRYTGKAIAYPGAKQNGKAIDYKGSQIIKFPFQTQKETYQYWDGTASKPMDMKYVGTEDIRGLKTYKFQGSLPLEKFREQEVPRGLFGLPDTHGVVADRLYQNTRTLWIEPETGVIVKLQEQQHQELRNPEAGAKPANAVTTNSIFTDATIKQNVDDYKTKAMLLKILRIWAPLGLGILGVLLILGGIAMSLVGRRNPDYDEDEQYAGLDETFETRRGRATGGQTI
ncbi:DUF3068 domain-containing protein [Luteipulveratus halotolerans]|uniref:DUF3068 domain-containing protein n=1 Tax=Luteipulveratus halotolerans TaxID=1631356 RepID=UPI0008FC0921|nr:DUF3068 domain-containing protein [Luteipulveratus halotolerans]